MSKYPISPLLRFLLREGGVAEYTWPEGHPIANVAIRSKMEAVSMEIPILWRDLVVANARVFSCEDHQSTFRYTVSELHKHMAAKLPPYSSEGIGLEWKINAGEDSFISQIHSGAISVLSGRFGYLRSILGLLKHIRSRLNGTFPCEFVIAARPSTSCIIGLDTCQIRYVKFDHSANGCVVTVDLNLHGTVVKFPVYHDLITEIQPSRCVEFDGITSGYNLDYSKLTKVDRGRLYGQYEYHD